MGCKACHEQLLMNATKVVINCSTIVKWVLGITVTDKVLQL